MDLVRRCRFWVLAPLLCIGLVSACKSRPKQTDRSNDRIASQERAQTARRNAALSLPYLSSAPVSASEEQKKGVIQNVPERVFRGLTVYCDERSRELLFVNLDGDIVHRIRPAGIRCNFGLPFQKDFLVIGDKTILRIDWNSRVVWSVKDFEAHHDFAIDGDGNINVLIQRIATIQHKGKPLAINDNGILTLSPDGAVLRSVWMSELLRTLIPEAMLDSAAAYMAGTDNPKAGWNNPTDLFHINTITFLDRDRGNTRAGNVLLCSRHLDSLFAIDLKSRQVTWRWGTGILEGPHHPTQVAANLLVLDNGMFRGHSRLLEIEPEGEDDADIEWQYEDPPEFFTASRGGAQRLANGNHFITQADSGRLFEIAPDKTIVWEYWNPNLTRAKSGKPAHRVLIYRAYRLAPEEVGAPEFRALFEAGLTRAERQQRSAVR